MDDNYDHLHGVVSPTDEHEKDGRNKNEKDNDDDDISIRLFVLWMVDIKTTFCK